LKCCGLQEPLKIKEFWAYKYYRLGFRQGNAVISYSLEIVLLIEEVFPVALRYYSATCYRHIVRNPERSELLNHGLFRLGSTLGFQSNSMKCLPWSNQIYCCEAAFWLTGESCG